MEKEEMKNAKFVMAKKSIGEIHASFYDINLQVHFNIFSKLGDGQIWNDVVDGMIYLSLGHQVAL